MSTPATRLAWSSWKKSASTWASRVRARGEPRVELGRPEAVGGQHAVDAERPAVAVRRPQVLADPAGDVAQLLAVGVRRVPGAAQPAVDERARGAVAQHRDLDRPQRGGAVGQHEAVDRAGHAVEERHHPHLFAARREERVRADLVVVVGDPAHEVAAAGEPATGPHRAERAADSSAVARRQRLGQRRDDPARAPPRGRRRPRPASASGLVLQGQERARAAAGDRPAEDRLVARHERRHPEDPAPVRVERLDRGDRFGRAGSAPAGRAAACPSLGSTVAGAGRSQDEGRAAEPVQALDPRRPARGRSRAEHDRTPGVQRRPGGRGAQASASTTRRSDSSSRPTTVVPSAAVMIGRWSARGWAASAASQSSRWAASLGRSMPSSRASFARATSHGSRPEAGDDLAELGGGRRVVEVAAHGVLDARCVQLRHRGPALRAGRVQPDLHHSTSSSVAPVIAASSSNVVE